MSHTSVIKSGSPPLPPPVVTAGDLVICDRCNEVKLDDTPATPPDCAAPQNVCLVDSPASLLATMSSPTVILEANVP